MIIIFRNRKLIYCFVRLHTILSVVSNGILSLKWRQYGKKGDILDFWVTLIFLIIIL